VTKPIKEGKEFYIFLRNYWKERKKDVQKENIKYREKKVKKKKKKRW
jgi:hypothetical protein